MKTYQKPETVNVNIDGADLMTGSPQSMLGEPEVSTDKPMAPKKMV